MCMKKVLFSLCLILGMCELAFAGDWMSRLPDHIFVSQVSIPGTHDAATGNGVSLAMFSQCQDVPVDKQWAAGVRAFDLRPIVNGDHLHINHGVAQTDLRFDDALYLLRDSLIAHPTEFAVVHMLYANNYSDDKATYAPMLNELLSREDLKDYLVEFKRGLKVSDVRGKILILSREQYDTAPYAGGFFMTWCGYLDWAAQTSGTIKGKSNTAAYKSTFYVQDYSTTESGDAGLQVKVDAVKQMLDFSTKYTVKDASKEVWVFNFASSYSGSLSTSDSYRKNAAACNAAIIDYLKTNEPGPTGVILMDFACVDSGKGFTSGTVNTRGQELIDTLIANNFKWLDKVNRLVYDEQMARIEGIYKRLDDLAAEIPEKYPDVADDFVDDLAEGRAAVEAMKAELDSLYAGYLLQEGYKGNYTRVLASIISIGTKAKNAQAEHDEMVRVNKEVYDEQTALIDSLNRLLDELAKEIAETCPDVASDFADELAEGRAKVDTMKAELDSLYAGYLLKEDYDGGYDSVHEFIVSIGTKAKDAQAEYEEAAGVEGVRVNEEEEVSTYYSLTGERLSAPRKNAVNIVRYSSGRVAKILF